jgi:hypothetical protein
MLAVVLLVALICVTTSAITSSPDHSRITGRPKENRP